MSSDSVKVCDLELEKLGDLAKCWDDIEAILGEYVMILNTVQTETVKAGHIHDAIERLHLYASDCQKYAKGLGSQAASTGNSLARKAEAVDLNLYNGV